MKRNYIIPAIGAESIETENLLGESCYITGSEGYLITYGGIDEDGVIDPSSRITNRLWDFDEADE